MRAAVSAVAVLRSGPGTRVQSGGRCAPAESRGCNVELVQDLRAKRAHRGYAKAIASPAAAVEQPVAAGEGIARRASSGGPAGGVLRQCLCRRRQSEGP